VLMERCLYLVQFGEHMAYGLCPLVCPAHGRE
jgi:hypothetical protein